MTFEIRAECGRIAAETTAALHYRHAKVPITFTTRKPPSIFLSEFKAHIVEERKLAKRDTMQVARVSIKPFVQIQNVVNFRGKK